MKKIRENNSEEQCRYSDPPSALKKEAEMVEEEVEKFPMEEIIVRLRAQKEGSRDRWLEKGRQEGLRFVKDAHYETLQQALSWEPIDSNFSLTLVKAYAEAEWDDIFSPLCDDLGVQEAEDLHENPLFFEWARGFMDAVRECWDEMADKL